MTNCTGIIAEYNPFHNGHLYHIQQTKVQNGTRPVIVVMSGWFVQRGSVASFDPYLRARWALECGVDMVLQLPVLFSLANAERFARGGVYLLNSTGIVDSLSFGSETGDIAVLGQLAENIYDVQADYRDALSSALSSGRSFPAAQAAALHDALGKDAAELFSKPNNILAIEYIKSIKAIGASIYPITIKRSGADHDATFAKGASMSASAIRSAIDNGSINDIRTYVPSNVYDEICNRRIITAAMLSQAIIYALRRYALSDLSAIPDVSEGLENLIYSACRNTSDYDELIMSIKSKRYTHARIRRICFNALLGITKTDYSCNPFPRYIRVLGVRQDSLSLLGELARNATLPVITCHSDYNKLDFEARAAFDKDIAAADIAQLTGKSVNEFARKLIIV